jgi:hypothetical protein
MKKMSTPVLQQRDALQELLFSQEKHKRSSANFKTTPRQLCKDYFYAGTTTTDRSTTTNLERVSEAETRN